MFSTLPLGEKIKHIRQAKGVSQESMAQALNYSKATVSRFESGQMEINDKTLRDIKVFLGVEDAPLFEHELKLYNSRIWVWNDLLETKRIAHAKAMISEMAVIINLPFEHDLYTLYHVTEAWLRCKEFDIPNEAPAARLSDYVEEKLKPVENLLDYVSDEALALYYRVKSYICLYTKEFKNSIPHSHKAIVHAEKCNKTDLSSLFNLGQAYYALGRPYNAIIYFERIKTGFQGNISHPAWPILIQMLVLCYIPVGEYSIAKNLCELAFIQAKSINDKYRTGIILNNFGSVNYRKGNYEEGINYCDQALQINSPDKSFYVHTLRTKALCLLEMKKFDTCREVLEQAKGILEQANPDEWRGFQDMSYDAHIIEAISHLLSRDNSDSINYIQDVAIPHLRAGGMAKFDAIDLCIHLESHYNKKRAKTKANAIAAIRAEIYREVFLGDD